MTRETKLNLLFLGAILLVSAPGLVILIHKKMQPGARSMSEAAYVRRTVAYNDPQITPSKSVRILPPATAAWVEEVSRQRLGHDPLRRTASGGRREPVMSDNRRFELLSVQAGPTAVEFILLAWLEDFGNERVTRVGAELRGPGGAEMTRAEQVDIEPLAVPAAVVAELKDEGYVLPPARAALVRLSFVVPAAGGDRLELTWSVAGSDDQRDSLAPGTGVAGSGIAW